MNKAIVINCLGGPGSGKSTMSAHVFAELKWLGVNCEIVTEFAKDKVWAEDFKALENQIYMFANQQRRIQILLDKVDVIITDSPLIMGISYLKEDIKPLKDLIVYEFKKLNTHNFFLNRIKAYNPAGRMQTLEEAIEKDQEIKSVLDDHNIQYQTIEGIRDNVKFIVDYTMEQLKNNTSHD